MKKNNIKRIPVSYSLSAFMFAFGLLMTHIAKQNIDTFSDFFSSPINTVYLLGMIFVYMSTIFYYEISDNELRVKVFLFTKILGKRIQMDHIHEVGVTTVNPLLKNPFRQITSKKISYIILNTVNNGPEYYFLVSPSARLYAYLSENYDLPFVESTIDYITRIKISSNTANKRAEKNKKPIITTLIVIGIIFLFMILSMSIYLIYTGITGEENILLASSLAVLLVVICYYSTENAYGDIMSRMAEFEFSENGLLIVYPNNKKVFYAWTDFELVGTCMFRTRGSKGYGDTANYVICFVTQKAKKNRNGRWPVGDCSYKTIPYTQYSDEKYEKLKQYYPGEIAELIYIS